MEEGGVERKLAAVLSADVVGYSRLMQEDDKATLKALALGSLGYRALGVRVLGFRYDEARRAVERALNLSPNLFMVRFAAGMVSASVGEGDAALGHFSRAMRLSPLDPGMSALVLGSGLAHLVAGRYDEALAAAQRTVDERPNFASGHRLMLVALGYLGRIDEAKLAARRMLELAPDYTVSRYEGVSPLKNPEFRKRGAEILRAAGVPN